MCPGGGDIENSDHPCFNLYVTQVVPLAVNTAMSKVLIHPATYQNLNLALDRIFELFPLGEESLDQTERASGVQSGRGYCDPSRCGSGSRRKS